MTLNEQIIEQLLQKVREVALKRPDNIMMFVSECTALLALEQFPPDEMSLFEDEAYSIIHQYVGNIIWDDGIIRDNKHVH